MIEITYTLISATILFFLSFKIVHMLQLGGYKLRPFGLWIIDWRNRYMTSLFVVSLLGFGMDFGLQMFISGIWTYLGLVFYLFLSILLITLSFRATQKVPLRFTKRIWRLLIMTFIICTVISYVLLKWAGVHFVTLLAVGLPVIVFIAHLLLWPAERIIRNYYIRKARKKLFSPEYKDLIRIGITGSYGKTSCKNILTAMLSSKYKVAASPASYNTPTGFSRTVNHILTPEHEVFIMEMGARFKGDIKHMTKLFKPTHGILTGVGLTHIETFKTVENLRAEKFELVNALPAAGFRVIGDEVDMKDVPYYKTNLLGAHNQKNIHMCALLAEKLGISKEQIKAAAADLRPIPHRLELLTNEVGVNILDDSYNASPNGTVAALEVLKELKKKNGGAAVILTPGLVELGKQGDEENFKFGVRIAAAADKAIIVNDLNRQMLNDGLLAGGMAAENIFNAKDLESAKPIYASLLKKGDILLIENDLPDNFI